MIKKSDKTGIYVHIPFCCKKCSYCDFYSITDYGLSEKYFNALIRNIRLAGEKYPKREIDSVFFGGGTPSSVDGEYLRAVIECLSQSFVISPDCEITIEANPATVDERKLEIYKSCGINRISMGVQSAVDGELGQLSRIHSFKEFQKSFALCRDCGFDNINLDVMLGIPQQTKDSLIYTLTRIAELDPEHISVYMLSIEEDTPFGRMRNSLELPDEDTVCDMYLLCHHLLCNSYGYHHYEISNFSKNGRECRHNLKYWMGQDYISFGPAAHSYVDGVRYSYERNIHKYINSSDFSDVCENITAVSSEERLEDEIIFGLRLSSGIDLSLLEGRDGRGKIDVYAKLGYVNISNGRLSLTPKGMLISNSIISDVLL